MKNLIILSISSLILFFSLLFYTSYNDQIRAIYVINSCFGTAILFILNGLLTYVLNEGGFDGLKYASRTLFRFSNTETYGDYKERIKDKAKKKISIPLVIGGIYLAISLILNIIFI